MGISMDPKIPNNTARLLEIHFWEFPFEKMFMDAKNFFRNERPLIGSVSEPGGFVTSSRDSTGRASSMCASSMCASSLCSSSLCSSPLCSSSLCSSSLCSLSVSVSLIFSVEGACSPEGARGLSSTGGTSKGFVNSSSVSVTESALACSLETWLSSSLSVLGGPKLAPGPPKNVGASTEDVPRGFAVSCLGVVFERT
ncbi:hypothetical protein K491DRAFT_130570 [Lophiostoma macrostomum CBS 122681]|uniref:Uncharacterized protein n=1 Tax=Lophiostoma macrostomum CBS 122681 TaxID=1314788 RepID=A0A6A6SSE1_9PLEO|nr:hypothetical protein K491DRAFT_130570 [Lophiostoma macrostomum CBS 122681]